MDFTAHLNELNVSLQGENHLIYAMFQIITVFETKIMTSSNVANNFKHFVMLVEHSPVISEKYAAMLYILIQEFENRLQDFQKKPLLFCIFATPFSLVINTLPANFHMECTELQSDVQLKEKIGCVSLPEKNIPLRSHTLFTSSVFGCTFVNKHCQR